MFDSADNPTCGLNISDRSIEVLKLDQERNVKTFARASLEPGIVVNGEVLKKKKLAGILEELFEEASLSCPKLVLSLPESKVFVDYFELSQKLEKKKLREEISKHAQSNVPLEENKVYWDFIKREDEQKTRVIYVAVLREVVRSYLDVLKELEAELEIVGIESLALKRALLSKDQKKAVAIADIGARSTNLSFFNGERLLNLTVSEQVAGDQLDKKIKEKLGVELERAKELRETQGLQGESDQAKKVKSILEDELDQLVLGIERAFEHYRKDLDLEVEEIILAGGCALIPGLVQYLEDQLDVEIGLGDPLKNIKAEEPFKEKQNPILFAPVIGLALTDFDEDENQINFLRIRKQELQAQKEEKEDDESESWLEKLRNSTLFAFVLFLLGMAFLGYVLYANLYKASNPSPPPEGTNSVQSTSSPQSEEKSEEATTSQATSSSKQDAIIDTEPSSTSSAQAEIEEIEIDSPDIGWLNVRPGPSSENDRLTTVAHGETFQVLEEKDNWYKIKLEEGQIGWVSADYTQPVED